MIAALAVALRYHGDGGPHPPRKASVPVKEVQAERVLTLLDFWAQTLVPDILLQQSRAHSLRVGDVANAARLEHRIRRDLLQAEGFEAAATRDPALRNHNSVDARALRAAAAGWDDWVSALLGRATSQRHGRARHIAELEAKAVRLHQAAYAAVDASLKAALETR